MRSRKKWVILLISVVISILSRAQGSVPVDEITHTDFDRQVHIGREQSMLTIGNGIGNVEPLLWEGQFATQYAISHRTKPWSLVFNPRAVIRMVDGESFPLRPPSFHVDATYYRQIGRENRKESSQALFLGIGHHSNGQEGVFYLPGDSIVNLVNGNFAQNHLEMGWQIFRNELLEDGRVHFKFLKVHARITPPFSAEWSGIETLDRLGFYRPFVTIGSGGISNGNMKGPFLGLRKNSNLIIHTGFIIGEMKGDPENELSKRTILDVQYQYVLPFFKDIALTSRFYRGQDYYNIRFVNTLSVLTFGFSSNIGTIKSPVRYIGSQ